MTSGKSFNAPFFQKATVIIFCATFLGVAFFILNFNHEKFLIKIKLIELGVYPNPSLQIETCSEEADDFKDIILQKCRLVNPILMNT